MHLVVAVPRGPDFLLVALLLLIGENARIVYYVADVARVGGSGDVGFVINVRFEDAAVHCRVG